MNYSLATPCSNCSHPANVHVIDPAANEEHGKKCVTCSCVNFQPDFGSSVRCKARMPSDPYVLCRGEAPAGAVHLGDHFGSQGGLPVRWSHEAGVLAEKGTRHQQVGGDHYRKHKIQPWQIWEEYGLDPWQANALKYLLRAGRKEGVKASEDYRKAIHYLQYLVERAGQEESGNG